jgi:hypothetical protein
VYLHADALLGTCDVLLVTAVTIGIMAMITWSVRVAL